MGTYIDNTGAISPYMSGVIDWRMSKSLRYKNYEAMAEGYLSAASTIMSSLMEDNIGHPADVEVFPAIFCIHQGIELSLKGLLLLINSNTKEQSGEQPFETTHDLNSLLNQLNSAIKNNDNCVDHEILKKEEATAPLFDFIDDCRSLAVKSSDPNTYYVDFARYPERPGNGNRKLDKYFFVARSGEGIFVDLRKLKQGSEDIASLFSGLFGKYEAAFEPIR